MAAKKKATKVTSKKGTARPAAKKKASSKQPQPSAETKALMDLLLGERDGIRTGSMFGCPGYFVGKRAVGCVYGEDAMLTFPKERAEALCQKRGFRVFEVMGRKMGGWVLMDRSTLKAHAKELVPEAMACAKAKD